MVKSASSEMLVSAPMKTRMPSARWVRSSSSPNRRFSSSRRNSAFIFSTCAGSPPAMFSSRRAWPDTITSEPESGSAFCDSSSAFFSSA